MRPSCLGSGPAALVAPAALAEAASVLLLLRT